MRSVFTLFAIAALLSACSSRRLEPCPAGRRPGDPGVPKRPVVISVVGTSDLHGNIQRGLAFSGYVDNLRKLRSCDGGVVLVDAGDMFQGTIAANDSEGAAVIRLYNAIGYDAAAIGNHEFDYGPVGPASIPASPSDDRRGALLAAVKLARFPVLNANLLSKDSGNPVQWPGVVPSTLLEVAGVKIGIVGVTTIDTLSSTISANVDDLKVAPLEAAVNTQARKLREQGARVVVVAAHAGGGCKYFDNPEDLSSCAPDQEVSQMARALEPNLVDVIVGGHTHRAMAHRVKGIPIIQSRANGEAFGRVDLTVDPVSGAVTATQIHQPHAICKEKGEEQTTCTASDYEGAPSPPMAQAMQAVAQDLAAEDAKRKQSLGVTLATRLTKHGRPSSPLGDQVAAWMLEMQPAAQLSYVNSGGLRKELPSGPLTYGSLFEMFPFDNQFATAAVKVGAVRKMLAKALSSSHGFSVAGLQLRAKCGKGGVVVELFRNGQPLQDDETLVLLTSDYLAMSPMLAEAGIPKESFKIEEGRSIREGLAEHLRKKGGTLPAPGKTPISILNNGFPMTCPL